MIFWKCDCGWVEEFCNDRHSHPDTGNSAPICPDCEQGMEIAHVDFGDESIDFCGECTDVGGEG